MSEKHVVNQKGNCTAEDELAHDFPDLFASYVRNAAIRPDRCEIWERVLRVARNCEPILRDIRSRGLHLLRLDQYHSTGYRSAATLPKRA
jgi:hypothetical protein